MPNLRPSILSGILLLFLIYNSLGAVVSNVSREKLPKGYDTFKSGSMPKKGDFIWVTDVKMIRPNNRAPELIYDRAFDAVVLKVVKTLSQKYLLVGLVLPDPSNPFGDQHAVGQHTKTEVEDQPPSDPLGDQHAVGQPSKKKVEDPLTGFTEITVKQKDYPQGFEHLLDQRVILANVGMGNDKHASVLGVSSEKSILPKDADKLLGDLEGKQVKSANPGLLGRLKSVFQGSRKSTKTVTQKI